MLFIVSIGRRFHGRNKYFVGVEVDYNGPPTRDWPMRHQQVVQARDGRGASLPCTPQRRSFAAPVAPTRRPDPPRFMAAWRTPSVALVATMQWLPMRRPMANPAAVVPIVCIVCCGVLLPFLGRQIQGRKVRHDPPVGH